MKSGHSSTHKQVVVRRTDKQLVKGFVDPPTFLGSEGVEVIDREGRLLHIPLQEIKGVFFVRDLEGDPQRAERKLFQTRPRRLAGLWVRMTFKDDEVLEGLLANNLLGFDPRGFLVTPPDIYSNNLKIFIPRSALAAVEVLGIVPERGERRVGAKPGQADAAEKTRQIGLFAPAAPISK